MRTKLFAALLMAAPIAQAEPINDLVPTSAIFWTTSDGNREVLDAYAAEAKQAGSAFIEIQNTMLFATVGQKTES